MTTKTMQPERTGFTVGYHLGSIGTWLRLLLGVLVPLGYLGAELTGEAITSDDRVETAGWLVVVFAVYFTAHWMFGERFFAQVNPWVSTVILYGPVFVVPYLDFLPLTFRLGLGLYISLSVFVVIFIRYGGCEMVGIPSLILRRRYVVYCPWNTVDLADKAIIDSRWSRYLDGWGPKVTAAVVMATVLGLYPKLTPPLPQLPRPVFWGTVVLAGVVALGAWVAVRSRRASSSAPKAPSVSPKHANELPR